MPANRRIKLTARTKPLDNPPPVRAASPAKVAPPAAAAAPAAEDSSKPKPNPFGAARAVDTTQREREIEEKLSSLRMRRTGDDKFSTLRR
eukprot:646-Heterococcus_DN1.PRE.1